MELELRSKYFVAKGDETISSLDWDKGTENDKAIVLSRKEKDGTFTVTCYNKKNKKHAFLMEKVKACNVTNYGVIMEVYRDLSTKETKWGVITFDGKLVIPFEFSYIESCNKHEQFLYVSEAYTGVYDYNGKKIIEEDYNYFTEYETCIVYGSKKCTDMSPKYGILFVKTGKIVKPKYSDIMINAQCIIVRSLFGNSGAFSLDGDVLLEDKWKQILVEEHKGKSYLLAREKIEDYWSCALYTLPEGKCIIPSKNSYVVFLDCAIKVVYNRKKYSELFSYDGEKILPGVYNDIEDLGCGKLLTNYGHEYTIFTYDGKVIHSGKYVYVSTQENPIKCCQFILCNMAGIFMYIPYFNTFIPGYNVRSFKTGKIEYYNINGEWIELSEDEYNNAERIKSLYEYKGE